MKSHNVLLLGDVLARELGEDLDSLEQRLLFLENKVLIENGGLPENFKNISLQIDALRAKIEVHIP